VADEAELNKVRKKIPPKNKKNKNIFTHDINPNPHLTGSLLVRVLHQWLLPHGGEAALAVPHSLLPPAQPEGKVVDVLKPQKTEQQEQKTVPHTWFLLYRVPTTPFLASISRIIYSTPTPFHLA
jgi:hypothetical protein